MEPSALGAEAGQGEAEDGVSDPGNQRYTCAQCTMSFRIGLSPRQAAVTRCSQCRLLFWHGQPDGVSHVVVGITLAELHQQGVEVTA